MPSADFAKLVASICEHSNNGGVWSWSQLANRVFKDGKRTEDIGRILNSNSRYWKKAAGLYMLTFEWESIIEDGLLPPARDPDFLHLCRRVAAAGLADESLDYHRLAEVAFGADSDRSRAKIALLVTTHRRYISMPIAAQVRFLWGRIGILPDPPDPAASSDGDLITELLTALGHEYRDSAREARRYPQVVGGLERITSKVVLGDCYKGRLEDREDEDPIILLEGMPVVVEWSQDIVVSAVLLVHDVKAMEVVLQFEAPQVGSSCKIYPDTSRLLKGYRPFVERLRSNPLALSVLEGSENLRDEEPGSLLISGLRPRQEAAVRRAISNQVLFVWGPPGTGKTHTVAALIAELALSGERVLATSISNRAVDELTQDVFDRLSEMEKGRALLKNRRVLRLGFAGNDILEHDELFPHRIESQAVREEILRVKQLRETSKSVEEKAGLQQQLTLLEDRLARIVKDSLGYAKIVLTTVAQVALIKEFRACEPGSKAAERITDPFDTVVCDEASMMNATHLIPVCWWGRKRVVIAGDYKQLGPVVISTSKPSLTHLHTSLFELELRRPEGQRRMVQLTQQSRMHESICSLVSGPFYGGKLETLDWNGSPGTPPLMKENRLRAGLLHVRDGETRMTKRGSRMNPAEAQIVMRLLRVLLAHGEDGPVDYKRIGIVTAYRAQAGHIRQLLRHEKLDKTDRVQIGTVHAFQGGEAEAIIWSLVDSHRLVMPDGRPDPKRKGKPGKLFIDKTGERLLNVAISRAKAAVYVVGDIDLFLEHSPNPPMGGILRRIRDEGHSWERSILRG